MTEQRRRPQPPLLDTLGKLCTEGKEAADYLWQGPKDKAMRQKILDLPDQIAVESGKPDRDRFVLSCGHACVLLYSALYLAGYDLTLDDLKQFRQWGSRTPGHSEHGVTPGVEATTGPLGQGVGNAVGMAIAEAQLAALF